MERNGLDLDLWDQVREAVREDPEEARVVVRTQHRWNGGFSIAGQRSEIESAGEITARTFEFPIDWPEDVGGSDTGPSPGEALLGALGGCVGLTYIANAVNSGIDIDQLEITIEGQADLQALFGAGDERAGLTSVSIRVNVKSDADEEELAELGRATTRSSTVFDSIMHAVPVSLTVVSED